MMRVNPIEPNSQVAGRVAQFVRYVTADKCLTADQAVGCFIPARSYTFVEIDHEIISVGRVVFSYKRKYVHEVLVNHLVKLARKKCLSRHDHSC